MARHSDNWTCLHVPCVLHAPVLRHSQQRQHGGIPVGQPAQVSRSGTNRHHLLIGRCRKAYPQGGILQAAKPGALSPGQASRKPCPLHPCAGSNPLGFSFNLFPRFFASSPLPILLEGGVSFFPVRALVAVAYSHRRVGAPWNVGMVYNAFVCFWYVCV